ncbi:ribonuclease P 40kDa subunit-domain-containing protein [Daldinia caldariorum]|uniref:ribonuclease P 40kDa subunit-domain-containing protein n=1 Tax=Daldinia caldariorum TaxID=326644 RepID=UPI00200733AA|nr:ribonuclease P 40kDa subunit-domain-containing protein [Daldinia caldariorum]KAI1467678.1 ribonuclease P 40kDa subunit-domain-containing protein [Daldinia caldariorum]
MFSFSAPSVHQSSKCFVTYGVMGHPDPQNLPTKGKPWSTLLSQDFVYKVDLILPAELTQLVKDKLIGDPSRAPVFYKVIMKLGQVLEGDFFTEYIKIGNIMMLSEGRIDSENVFSLKEGVLTMYLDKETYERAGLVGRPHGVKGKRGLKPRWIVQFDLRSPSMLHGKKGFDRLAYACKNVFNAPVTWLFHNLSKTPVPDPLSRHYPVKYTSYPKISEDISAKMPSLKPPATILSNQSRLDLDEFATDLYEWLSLVRLDSPRINVDDKIDPYLSSYAVPGDLDDLSEGKLCRISWQGFVPPRWTRQTLVDVILALPAKSWFSLSTTTFARDIIGDSADCTIFRPPNASGEYLLWDIRKHN